MGFKKGEGGRPKGAKNKHTFNVEEMAQEYELDPFKFMMAVINNDWQKLGFSGPTKTTFTMNGIEVEEDNIPVEQRVKCAGHASKFLYSAKQAIEVSGGEKAIEIIVRDYTSGK